MTKLAVIGRGTAGCMSVIHFLRWTDWDIEWYFDPNTATQAVGEATTIRPPSVMFTNMGFDYEDLRSIQGTVKTGIRKIDWGDHNHDYVHKFFPPQVGFHFSASELQDLIIERISKSPRIKIIHSRVTANDIDSDYVMDCSGRPKSFEDFNKPDYIPVDSVYTVKCYWDHCRFNNSLQIALKHGWAFGIPLQDRCSIGYLYNSSISSLDEVKQDIENVFDRFNLTPSNGTNSFKFYNYYRKRNFDRRVCYNGNASFFLEPMESTSITMMDQINRWSFDYWHEHDLYHTMYRDSILEVEDMIMLHYMAGSKHKTKFWDFATERGRVCIEGSKQKHRFSSFIRNSKDLYPLHEKGFLVESLPQYGTWWEGSFFQNLTNLNLYSKLGIE